MDIIKKRTWKICIIFFVLVLYMIPNEASASTLNDALASFSIVKIEETSLQYDAYTSLKERNEIADLKNQIKSIIESLPQQVDEFSNSRVAEILESKSKEIDTIWNRDTLQKILEQIQSIQESEIQLQEIRKAEKKQSELEQKGQLITASAYQVGSPGKNLCAAWVSYVVQQAGFGYIGGNANDLYWNYCHSSNRDEIRAGMIIAVPSHTNTYMGGIYGHTGIIVQHDNQFYVRENVGYIQERPLDEWINYYSTTYTVQWGWPVS